MRIPRTVAPLCAGLGVVVVTALLRAVDADLTVAALVYIVVVVLTALLGYWAGAVGAVLSYLALNYWFIPQHESFTFSNSDDLVPLVVFGLAAVASGLTVARVNGLRRRAEEHEREAFDARLVAAVNESRAGFLAAMTHNLRTPLASIKTAVSTLQDPQAHLDVTTRARLLQIAHDESERLERLVNKVLEMSRIHAGVIEPRREPTDVGELARSAVRRLRYLAGRDRVRLSVAGDVLVVSVDPEMIELALVSVLENALRFAPPDTEVAVVAESSDDGGCVIRVIDHGPGIPVHQRDKVFEEFARLDGPGDNGGSGLGLAIARAFVDAHRGSMRVDTTPGGGATFVIRVPDQEHSA